jgi:hypothetical protein
MPLTADELALILRTEVARAIQELPGAAADLTQFELTVKARLTPPVGRPVEVVLTLRAGGAEL